MAYVTRDELRKAVINTSGWFLAFVLFLILVPVEVSATETTKQHTTQYINNVKVQVGDRKVTVETRGGKHIFSENCIDYSCHLYNSIIDEPYIEIKDGVVQSNPVLTEVNLANASKLKRINDILFFVVNRTSVSGLYWTVEHYYVNTKNLTVVVQKTSQDVYKHGLPDPQKTVALK